MNECYSGPTDGSAVQTKGNPQRAPASQVAQDSCTYVPSMPYICAIPISGIDYILAGRNRAGLVASPGARHVDAVVGLLHHEDADETGKRAVLVDEISDDSIHHRLHVLLEQLNIRDGQESATYGHGRVQAVVDIHGEVLDEREVEVGCNGSEVVGKDCLIV